MQVSDWRKVIGEMVRDHMRSPELERSIRTVSRWRGTGDGADSVELILQEMMEGRG
jgi:hypothetical protein